MFDLDLAVSHWKSDLASLHSLSSQDVKELEEHLRESVEALHNHGLSLEEAFAVAKLRLGAPSDIDFEYAKVNPGLIWRRRIFWCLVGYLCGIALTNGIGAISVFCSCMAAWIGWDAALAGIVGSVAGLSAWGLVLYALWRFAMRESLVGGEHRVPVWRILFLLIVGGLLKHVGNALLFTRQDGTYIATYALWTAYANSVIYWLVIATVVGCILTLHTRKSAYC